MNQKEFYMILLKYEAGQCTHEERSRVELWYKNLQLPKEIVNPVRSKAQIFENINAGLKKEVSGYWQWIARGMAAVLLIATSLLIPPPPPPPPPPSVYSSQLAEEGAVVANDKAPEPVINKTSSPQLVTLSDGTKITLEPESRLVVINFTQSVRQVRLQGKAFFEVAHNAQRPFFVYTENLVTRVLGTSFTINTSGVEGETVEVKTGRVAVFPKEGKSHSNSAVKHYVTITPNLQVEYNKARRELVSSVVKHPHIVVPVLAGRDVKSNSNETSSSFAMYYEETPVSEILKALEEAYCVKIVFDQNELSSCLLTVNLKEEDLFTRLQAICQAIGGSYQVAGIQVIVSSKRC